MRKVTYTSLSTNSTISVNRSTSACYFHVDVFTGCLQLKVSFRKRATNYWALLRKMTYQEKASYASSQPCSTMTTSERPSWYNRVGTSRGKTPRHYYITFIVIDRGCPVHVYNSCMSWLTFQVKDSRTPHSLAHVAQVVGVKPPDITTLRS